MILTLITLMTIEIPASREFTLSSSSTCEVYESKIYSSIAEERAEKITQVDPVEIKLSWDDISRFLQTRILNSFSNLPHPLKRLIVSSFKGFPMLSASQLERWLDEKGGVESLREFLIMTRESPYFLQLQEDLGNVDGEGKALAEILRHMPANKQAQALALIREKEPNYARSVEISLDVLNRGGVGPFPESTEALPNPSGAVHRPALLDSPQYPDVFMGEYLISSLEETPYLQTFGTGPCVVVSLFDKDTKTVGLAHLHAGLNTDLSMDVFISKFRSRAGANSRIEGRILGGAKGASESLVYDIERRFREDRIFIKENATLNTHLPNQSDFMISSETGEIYSYSESGSTMSLVRFLERLNAGASAEVLRPAPKLDCEIPFVGD